MALGQRDLERVGDYARGHLGTWLGEVAPLTVSVPQLLERAVRIETELKSQRELIGPAPVLWTVMGFHT